jgi:hypothetical protein
MCVPPKVMRPDAVFHMPLTHWCAYLLGQGAAAAAVLSSSSCNLQPERIEGEDKGEKGNNSGGGGGIMGRKGGGGGENEG